jgi:hypothetical protein
MMRNSASLICKALHYKNFSDYFIVKWFIMTQQLESYAPQTYASRQYSYTSEPLGLKRLI